MAVLLWTASHLLTLIFLRPEGQFLVERGAFLTDAGLGPEASNGDPACVSHPRGPVCVCALLVFILMVLI